MAALANMLNASAEQIKGEEIVRFIAEDGIEIEGSVFYPQELTSPDGKIDKSLSKGRLYPCVMLLHQWHADRYDWLPIIPEFLNEGFIVFIFDLRGHGKTYELEQAKGTDMELYDEDYTKEMLKDSTAAMDYLYSSINLVDKNRISLVGSSIGTLVAIQTCEMIAKIRKYNKIKSMALMSPAKNYFAVEVHKSILFCADVPILFILERNDPMKYHARNFISGIDLCRLHWGIKKVVIVEDIGHGSKMLKENTLIKEILDWIKQNH